MLRWIVWRDLILAWRRRADALSTLFFFVIVVSLFPLGIGPETELLRSIAPGVVWVAALLASMLSLGRLFANDYQDGTLEQLLMTPQPLVPCGLWQSGSPMAHVGVATYLYCTVAGCPVWSVKSNAERIDSDIDSWHSGAELDWIGRSSTDVGIAQQ